MLPDVPIGDALSLPEPLETCLQNGQLESLHQIQYITYALQQILPSGSIKFSARKVRKREPLFPEPVLPSGMTPPGSYQKFRFSINLDKRIIFNYSIE